MYLFLFPNIALTLEYCTAAAKLHGFFPLSLAAAFQFSTIKTAANLNKNVSYIAYISFLNIRLIVSIQGIWIGMICGIVCQTTTLCILTWRTNWDVQVSAEKLESEKELLHCLVFDLILTRSW